MTAYDTSVQGKTCVVTGANRGMGFAIARQLAAQGADVFMVCRDAAAGEAARAELERTTRGHLECVVADLSVQHQVRAAAEALSSMAPTIDVLINNAGAHITDRHLTVDGIEANLAVNHLAGHLLTRLVLPNLMKAESGRIVNVTSDASRKAASFDDLQAEREFSPFAVYGRAKLAMLMCTFALDRRLSHSRVSVNALHPGVMATDIVDDVAPKGLGWLAGLVKPFLKSPAHGARAVVELATARQLGGVSGVYFKNRKPAAAVTRAYDRRQQEALWQRSNALVGLDELDTQALRT